MALIIALIITVVFFVFIKPALGNKARPQLEEPYISVEYEPEKPKKKPSTVQQKGDTVLINGGRPSQITLLNASIEDAHAILDICEGNYSSYEAEKRVRDRLMEQEIVVNEIIIFQDTVRPVIERSVQKLISENEDWESMGEKDKKDQWDEYAQDTIEEYLDSYQSPNADRYLPPAFEGALSFLVTHSLTQIPLLREMIEKYGVANINTYAEYVGRKNPVITISNPDYRKPLENLVRVGLACSGKDLSVDEMLSSLSLNTLNDISGSETRFTRKDKAIKYISEKENVYSIIEKNIALRSLFALRPLPSQFSAFDFSGYSEQLSYYEALASVVVSVINGYATVPFSAAG